jgi:hypothetical protein
MYLSDYGVRPACYLFWIFVGICVVLSFALIPALPDPSLTLIEPTTFSNALLRENGTFSNKMFSLDV